MRPEMSPQNRYINSKTFGWLKVMRYLPLISWMLFFSGQFLSNAHANPVPDSLRHKNSSVASSPQKSFPSKKVLAVTPEDSEDSNERGNSEDPENQEDRESWESIDYKLDIDHKSFYNLTVIGNGNIEQSVFTALSKSVHNRKVLPFFMLYNSWKSYLH